MGLVQEFKEFALKGSVIDLAVGVVIGGAFSGIVKSLVDNIIMPPINLLTARSGVNFKEAALTIETESPKLDDAGKIIEGDGAGLVVQDYPILNYGPFTQTIFEFLLIALALFVAIKLINAARSRMEDEPEEEEVAKPSEDIQLLREIRDALQKS
ncbi:MULTISPECIES: large conductance mechanosensitive channel protein MscL [Rhodopirellula]|uniref:Large-conductance mechanosensitive channel n=2 Tax=Rhodopirellula TaxID=265488 RepID=M2A8S2_9BACT|nr:MULTISPECIES: large conductance mechanosensitive channel protein MscL [Rhodopirellula]EGF26130.1 Large-conductance mechanosensitive channel [Rhodopirellula baltica WH47]EMB18421.1 Large-conductance mechanosensitive channel [Rhodopirellula europaea 6C]MCR9211031.1 large conductance mechanosensitive channel protein MscL [bacterium]|tara:strand:+ start:45 stop:509 length:465 start_codon:yes stop_codon:yes gene_type:complete